MDFDKLIKKGLGGSKPYKKRIKRAVSKGKYGGRKDRDGDGVPNKKDCQPRNTMRQDNKIQQLPNPRYNEARQYMKRKDLSAYVDSTSSKPFEQSKVISIKPNWNWTASDLRYIESLSDATTYREGRPYRFRFLIKGTRISPVYYSETVLRNMQATR